MAASRERPASVWAYLFGATLLGASALYGGASLALDPSGGRLGLTTDLLAGTPFASYLVPGLVLFLAFGVGAVVAVYGVVAGRAWAWPVAFALGAGQVSWILVQVALLGGVDALHVVYGTLGAVLAGLAAAPSFRAAVRR